MPARFNRLFFILICSLFTIKTHAWNALGHRLVAQIASDYLTPETKQRLEKYNRALGRVYGYRTLVNAAPWMDSLRYQNELWLGNMHYINLPFSKDNTRLLPPKKRNAVTAIEYATLSLQNPQTSGYNKGFSLRVLLHVVGDIHQPMHAVSEYSHRYPKGDKGGNLMPLAKNPVAKTLHGYWDNGGGLLLSRKKTSAMMLQQKARVIEQHWPCHPDAMVLDPKTWANESYQTAVDKAYQIQPFQTPDRQYQEMVSSVSEKQLALAGCRLAALLNSLGKQRGS